MEKLARISNVITLYGQDLVLALVILVVGLIAAKMFNKVFRRFLGRLTSNVTLVSIVSNIVYVLIIVIVVAISLQQTGMEIVVIRRILAAITLAVVAIIIIFRPYIPTLPFKVGNTIKTGELLGKVEATTVLNTRIKTFDGKTVFVPNSKILNDYLINYHFTPERQIRLEIGITYRSDLLKAKKMLADILAEEPRVLNSPAARVFVLNLTENCVELAARPWVKNLDYWRTRCDLLEKIKLRFDREGITIAFPQRDIHIYQEPVEKDIENENKGSNEDH